MTISADGTFTWQGHTLTYMDEPYNGPTVLNERAIEVPIARRWLLDVANRGRAGLEVGNVLGHYSDSMPMPPRTVVDLWERAEGVRNEDLFGLTERFDWIVTISTLEHARFDGSRRDLTGGADAIAHLRSLLLPGGSMLVTVPMGHNRHLDDAILYDTLGEESSSTMILTADAWIEVPASVLIPYASRTMWASAVWVAIFDPL